MPVGRNYRRLIPFLIPHASTFAIALGCTLGFVATMPMLAQMLKWISVPIGQGDLQAISQLAAVGVVLFVIRGGFQYGQDSLMAKASLQVVLELRKQVYRHLHTLDLDYFAGARTGDLTYRMTEDLDRLGEVVLKFFHQTIPSVLTILSVLAYMVYLNFTLTVTTLIVAPLMGMLIGWFGDRLLSNARRSQDSVSDLSSLLTEVFSGIRLIRAFAAEDYEVKRFSTIAEQNRLARYLTEHVKAVQYPVVGFLYAMSVLLVFWLGGVANQSGAIDRQRVHWVSGWRCPVDRSDCVDHSQLQRTQAGASLRRSHLRIARSESTCRRSSRCPCVTGDRGASRF